MKESLLLRILGVLVDDEMKIAIRELALDAPAAVMVFATNEHDTNPIKGAFMFGWCHVTEGNSIRADRICRTLMRRYTPAETYAYVVGLEAFKQRQQERLR